MFFSKSRMAREDVSKSDRYSAHRAYVHMLELVAMLAKKLAADHRLSLTPVLSFDPEGGFVAKFVPLAFTPGEEKAYSNYGLWLTSDLYSGFAFQESLKDKPDHIEKFYFAGGGMSAELFVTAWALHVANTLNGLRRIHHMTPS